MAAAAEKYAARGRKRGGVKARIKRMRGKSSAIKICCLAKRNKRGNVKIKIKTTNKIKTAKRRQPISSAAATAKSSGEKRKRNDVAGYVGYENEFSLIMRTSM